MVDSARGQPDRVGDCGRGRVAVRDHDEPSQAEEVGASVRVGVETPAQPPGGGTDEQPTDGSARAGGDLLAQRVEQGADGALDGLERDVAGEAVGYEDVGGA